MRKMVGATLVAAGALWGQAGAAGTLGRETPRPEPVYATMAQAWTGVAPCLSMQQTSSMAAFAGAPDLGQPIDAKVAGLKLQAQPKALVEALRALAKKSGKDALARARRADCRDVACAAEAMYGPDAAPQILELAVRYHYVAVDKRTSWRAEELDQLVTTFGDLPDAWFEGTKAKRQEYRVVVRHRGDAWSTAPTPPSLTLIAMAGVGLPGILVQDGWTTLAPNAKRAAIVHEMAHEFSRRQPGRFRRDWREAMATDGAGGGTSTVSAYAQTNADEDFAESLTAYRYMAPALIRRAPARYAFLKAQVFGGLEYGSSAQCRRTYASAATPAAGD